MKYAAVIVLLLIATGWAGTAKHSAKTPAADALVIHNANTLIDAINHAKDLRIDSSDNTAKWLGYPTERGGLLQVFRKRDSVCKIIAEMVHGFGMVRIEFYYEHDSPVFIYEREDYFPMKKDSTLNTEKLDFGHDVHFYINNRSLVETKKRGKDKFGVPSTPQETLNKLLLMSDRWLKFR